MAESGIPERVRAFVREHIQSIEQVEVLLLLFRTAPREWTAMATGRELRIDPVSAARRLTDFQSHGLVQARPGDEALLYWYDGASGSLDRAISELAAAYRERRTALINLIISTPNDDVRVFADAFRLRRRGGDDDT
jgi:hypothetical protein